MQPTHLSNYIGWFLNIAANISVKEKVGAIEVVHSGNLIDEPIAMCYGMGKIITLLYKEALWF